MSLIISLFSSFFKTIGQLILILWQVVKWLFAKCWKFILLIGSLFLAIFSIKKAAKED